MILFADLSEVFAHLVIFRLDRHALLALHFMIIELNVVKRKAVDPKSLGVVRYELQGRFEIDEFLALDVDRQDVKKLIDRRPHPMVADVGFVEVLDFAHLRF